jgi:hypothetical protein
LGACGIGKERRSGVSVAILTIEQLLRQGMAALYRCIRNMMSNWDQGLFSPAIDSILA